MSDCGGVALGKDALNVGWASARFDSCGRIGARVQSADQKDSLPGRSVGVNPLGIQGIGEIGIVGINAAVANAGYCRAGKRVRELPI
jgi:hypothetical protein